MLSAIRRNPQSGRFLGLRVEIDLALNQLGEAPLI